MDRLVCYFCLEEVEEGKWNRHHPNFPKRAYEHLEDIWLPTHISCQRSFHRYFDKHCLNGERDCAICRPEFALQCLYNATRTSLITEKDLDRIVTERFKLAEKEINVSGRMVLVPAT